MDILIPLIALAVLIPCLLSHALSKSREDQDNHPHRDPPTPRTRRCPNCGSTATICGNRWECGHCGDFGTIK